MVMIDEIAVSRSFGAEAVIDVHTTEGVKRCGLAADSKLGQTWREDLAVMLAKPVPWEGPRDTRRGGGLPRPPGEIVGR